MPTILRKPTRDITAQWGADINTIYQDIELPLMVLHSFNQNLDAIPSLTDDEFVEKAYLDALGTATTAPIRTTLNGPAEQCWEMALLHDAKRRHVRDGHAADCDGETLYTFGCRLAAATLASSEGDKTGGVANAPERPCTCGAAAGTSPVAS